MSHAQENHDICARPECQASVPGSRWARIRAQAAGWFFQRDGTAWCPEHAPHWVKGWRERRDMR